MQDVVFYHFKSSFIILFYLFLFFGISWAAPTPYGGSQARGLIRAVAASLYHSHSNAGSELCLRPTPQLRVKWVDLNNTLLLRPAQQVRAEERVL